MQKLIESLSSQAFWLRSSVVSVLYSLTTIMRDMFPHVVNLIFSARNPELWLAISGIHRCPLPYTTRKVTPTPFFIQIKNEK